MQFSHAHPWIVLTLITGLSVLAAFQVPGLKQDPSAEGLTVQDDPARVIYEDTVKIFGTDKMTVIFIRDRELFSPPNSNAWKIWSSNWKNCPMWPGSKACFR